MTTSTRLLQAQVTLLETELAAAKQAVVAALTREAESARNANRMRDDIEARAARAELKIAGVDRVLDYYGSNSEDRSLVVRIRAALAGGDETA